MGRHQRTAGKHARPHRSPSLPAGPGASDVPSPPTHPIAPPLLPGEGVDLCRPSRPTALETKQGTAAAERDS